MASFGDETFSEMSAANFCVDDDDVFQNLDIELGHPTEKVRLRLTLIY